MPARAIRILVVDDYEPWRRYLSTTLRKQGLQVIGEVSDGLEAVQQAQELRPNLILLDIGLPTLNGIEAARRIRQVSPASKILFVSENRSADITEEALRTGAGGYVVKSDAAADLLPAVKTVLGGKRFVSASLADYGLNGPPNQYTADHPHRDNVVTFTQPQNAGITRCHEAGFYSDDERFLDAFTDFIGVALKAGNPVIVVATEPHRNSILLRLQAYGSDIAAAIELGSYIALDAAQTLATLMVNDLPDPARFLKVVGNLIKEAAKAVRRDHPRIAACGECAPLLLAQGNAEAALGVEHLWDDIAREYDVDVLCGYSVNSFQGGMGSHVFEKICAEHSAVHSR
jgi:DNA-binding NarL/FixJ family response regulator